MSKQTILWQYVVERIAAIRKRVAARQQSSSSTNLRGYLTTEDLCCPNCGGQEDLSYGNYPRATVGDKFIRCGCGWTGYLSEAAKVK